MAEKITIAELDIDIDSLLQKYTDTRREIDLLKESQKQLQAEGKRGTKQFSENEVAIKSLSTQYNQQKRLLGQMTDENQKLTSVNQTLTRAIDKEVVSIEQARKNNKELLAIRNKLNLSTKEGQKQAEALNQKLDQNNEFIKENVSQYEQQKINIGNYTESIKNAIPVNNELIQIVDNLRKGLMAKATAMQTSGNATAGASSKLKAFRVALISTGIGAIVVALGTLISAFASTQKGIDIINEKLAPLKGAFQGIIGVIQNISLNIFGQLGDRWTITSGLILNGIDKIRLGWNKITGDTEEAEEINKRMAERTIEMAEAQERVNKKSEEFSKILEGAGQHIKDSMEAQKQVEALTIRIRNAEISLVKQRAIAMRNIKAYNKIAEDVTKTTEERELNALKANQESERLMKLEQGVLDLKIRRLKISQTQNDTDAEGLMELSQLQAERTDKETQALEMQTTLTNKLNTIRQQGNAQQIKLIEEELQKFREAHEEKLKTNQFYSDELYKQDVNRLAKIEAKEREVATRLFEQGLITQQEYDKRTGEIDDKFYAQKLEKENMRKEAEKEKEAVDTENKRILREEQFLTDFQVQLERLRLQEEAELKSAEKTGASKTLIEKKFALQRAKVEEAKNDAIKKNNQETFALIGELLGQQSAVGKAVALFQAGINVQEGITKALAKGGFQGIFQAIAVASRGFQAVQKITSFDPPNTKLESGGLVPIGGKRHSAGGTKFYGEDGTSFEAERGELIGVMSRKASKHFMAFNNTFSPGASNNGLYANGGLITPRSARQTINVNNDTKVFAEILAEKVNDIKPVLLVPEVTDMQMNLTEISSGADI